MSDTKLFITRTKYQSEYISHPRLRQRYVFIIISMSEVFANLAVESDGDVGGFVFTARYLINLSIIKEMQDTKLDNKSIQCSHSSSHSTIMMPFLQLLADKQHLCTK